jgi:hypothetical protein
MTSIVRLKIQTALGFTFVSSTPFVIEGSADQFAVHRSVGTPANSPVAWAATHVETGFAFAHGRTSRETVKAAREVWGKTPESVKERSLTRARAILAEREEA